MTIPEVCRLAKEGAHTIAYSTEEEKNKMLTLAADALIIMRTLSPARAERSFRTASCSTSSASRASRRG